MGEFTALLKKNFIVWRRNTCGCICEVATVVLFGLLMVYVSSLVSDRPTPAKSYLKETIQITPVFDNSVPITPENFATHVGSTMDDMKMQMFKNCSRDLTKEKPEQGENDKYGFVALGPPSHPIIQDLEKFFNQGMGFKVQTYNTIKEIEDHIMKDNYGEMQPDGVRDQICFGVMLEQDSSNQWVYSVHYNVSQNPAFHDVKRLEEEQITKFVREDNDLYKSQIKNGFFYLINLIDNLILRRATSTNTARINAKLTKMPVGAYKTSNVYVATNEGDLLGLAMVFPCLIMFLRFVYSMLNEREKRIAQNLRNMGMNTWNYYMSWLFLYFLLIICYSTIFTLIVKPTLLPNVNFLMFWLCFFLTAMVFLSFGIFIVGFFTKAKPGVLCAIIFYFIFDGTRIAMGSFDNLTVNDHKYFALSPIASVGKVFDGMTILQSFYQDYGFFLFSDTVQNFKYSIFFWTAIIEIFVVTLLGIYVDLVFPKETGVRKHPLFCFKKRSKKVNKVDQDLKLEGHSQNHDAYAYEEIDEALLAQKGNNQTIEIENLRKVYSSNKKIAVDNLNLSMFKNQIFALLGHNGAGKTTTISMMSGLLPTTSGSIKIMGLDALEDTEQIKTIMGVCPQTNPIYPTLTCYEHLELYAYIKKTKKSKKELKEEIEQILKDIDLYDKRNFPAGKMSGGQKRKLCVACAFIGGSQVILLDEPTSGLDVAARRHLWEMLKKYKEDKIIILTTHFMDEADFLGDRIGIMGHGKLLTCGSSLFLKNKYGVGYSLTLVKAQSQVSTEKLTEIIQKHVPSGHLEDDISKELKYILPNKEIENFENLFKELEENKDVYGIQSFGVSLTTLEDVFLRVAKELGNNEKEKNKKTEEIIEENIKIDETVELEKIRVKNPASIFMMHFGALTRKRLIYFKRDLKGLICEVIIPIIVVFLGILITLIQLIKDSKEGWINASLLTNDPVLTLNTAYPALNSKVPTENITINTLPSTSIPGFDQDIANNFQYNRMMAAFISEVDTTNHIYGYDLFVNTTAPHGMNIGLNLINNAILKTATGDNNAYIKIKFDPLILTQNTRNFEGVVDGFLAVFLIALAFSFIPSSLIMFIVLERENNAKHQQIVSGVSLAAYWFSNLLIDYMKYFIVAVFTVIAILLFDATAFIEDGKISMVIALLLVFGIHVISFSYLVSFIFKGPSSAQVFMFLFSLLTGFILMLVSFVLRVIESSRDLNVNILEWIYRLLPMYNVCFGLFSIVSSRLWDGVFDLPDEPGAWSRYGALYEFIFAILGTVLCFILIFTIELAKGKVKKDDVKPEEIENGSAEIDEDVKKEEEEVKLNKDYSVKVQDVKKVYNIYGEGGCCSGKAIVRKKTAVKGITFGVKKGECFGLLGTNGAGKTTTFKMLSGEIQPTTGFAEVNGMNVAKDMKKIRNLIGYCPQFDALLEKLTAREHLEMYAAIKGIPKNLREKMISQTIKNLNLTKYEHVQAGTYSGGNKRKLSVAIALLGNPPVVFLDEPSSGMDPEARRFMWSVVGNISTKMKTSSVILTTHSMEEAEALSTKLAIMVEGRIECIGSVQALKNKYGKGFEVEAKINLPRKEEKSELMEKFKVGDPKVKIGWDDMMRKLDDVQCGDLKEKITEKGEGSFLWNEIKNKTKVQVGYLVEFVVIQRHARKLTGFMKENFGNVEILENYQSFYRYKIEDNVRLSSLFGTMQKNKEKLNLTQYSIKQTSIEQIFIGFAKDRVADDV